MDSLASSNAAPGPPEDPESLERVVNRCVSARLRFWALVIGLPLLFLLANALVLVVLQMRHTAQLTRELESLKTEAVRLGQAVEIYNPAWGTVIDAADPSRFPSRDPRDPRHGALMQQFTPRGNEAQSFQLRPVSTAPVRNTPLPEEAYLKHGASFLGARDFNRAIQAFQYCLTFYPESAGAHNGLAVALRDRGSFAEALASHGRAVELEPQRVELRWERAVTHLRSGDAEAAIKDCQAVLERQPEFADACNTMAMACRSRQQYGEALKHHDRAVELSPLREDFWRERGITHQANGDQAKAAADTQRAAELRQGRR
jgi:tetratricopeptide (TPR) repeat protein